MATVNRKAKGVRRSTAAKGRARTARAARARTGSVLDSLVSALPFTEEQLHRIFLAIILGGAVALALFVASLAGVPAMAQQQVALLAADAGFEVRKVRVTGVERMNEMKVYERALARRDRPMPLVDLEALRAELLELSWVKDARVSRQLPDSLVIDIVERRPHAVLRKPDRLMLIDDSGVELEPIAADKAQGMLIVAGPGAGRQVGALADLLAAAPALGPQVAEAEWIGNRRWNLTFDTGQVLALPQGEDESAGALVAFARLDGVNRLLGGKVATFDMRAPDRIYMRVPGRAAQAMATQEGE
ncbi:cell division protein FtsQ/DivIB [Pelagerythrobacter marinus]|uniref:cell division protein FtsQ/DivIB n=1 Tax=Pelagerythrobacter marinus TaxID=538382 RepID=UPI0020373129|nr:FtsQ-type POTRA domain-containing protein [Pelagerythrobacter marinus]USA40005.1 FtsQ-type POTRA domain-containing protein [Pelagerythrobacter marinus]WPZ05874.1 FtsQ-type POTRA domain-containing protein [Pelagerythrobacter marinus]